MAQMNYRTWLVESCITGVNLKFLDTGSTLLNLAISGDARKGWPLGTVNNIVGDSGSGKTFLVMTALACACAGEEFNDHTKELDDAEHADSFDRKKLFGSASRGIQPPKLDEDGEAENSTLVEDLESNIYKKIESKQKFIYGLDSMDSLSCKADEKVAAARIKAHEEGKEAKGSYGMGKAKLIGQFLRKAVKGIRKSESLLLIISQTRDNIDPLSFIKQTRSGGRALKFYSAVEMWMAEAGKITKTVAGEPMEIGVKVRIKIKKNKVNGKRRIIDLEIYYDYGIDDIGSCVDFLVKSKCWRKEKNSIVVDEWGFKGVRERLIAFIEDQELEEDLRDLMQEAWDAREDAFAIKRKPRF
jgi:RecA/RadA recombinase